MVCLTDLFATCAGLVGASAPADGAEDSLTFLPALLGKPLPHGRTTLIAHSNFGEFAYRDRAWKLVYRMSKSNLEKSRGEATVPELFNLESDVGETKDLSPQHPEIVERLTNDLRLLVDRGTSRPGQVASNDADVTFEATQSKRWAAAK